MSNINNKLDYLDETKQLIKQAIIDKGQEVSDEDTFRSYVDKIADIETGNDTKDATATSNDILYPETAYISNGKVTGNIMPTYSFNTTLSQTNTISRSLSYSLLDINYDAKIAIVSDEDYKFNFCNIANNEIDYENSAHITLNDFEEGMDGTYTFSKCCTNFDKNTNDLYLYLLFTFQNTFKVFCYIYNIKTKSSKYIDTYELTIDDANNSLVLNMMIRPNYPNQVIVFCGYTSTTALGSYLTTIFLQFNTVALELQKIEDTISTSANQYAALVESCYFTSNGEYLCINVRTGTLSGTTQNGVIYHCVNNFLESIVDSTGYVTLFENGNYIAYNQSTRNHCLFNVNGDVLYSYSGNLGEVSTEQLTYTNKCILGNYLFGFAYPEDFINPIEPLILYCCKLNEDYTIIKEYEINVGSRTLFNCYNAILYDNKTTRNFDGYLGDTEKEIISLERNNTVYFSTKDSDVTKNDVLQGKIFYNSQGKQIGNKIFTDYNDSVGILETNAAISATAVDQLIGVEMTILPDIEYLDKVKVNDIVKVIITIIDVATSSTTLKCNCLAQILEIIDHSDKQFEANVRILAADVNTEDGTATSEDIIEGKTAYVNNERVHGTMPNNNELNYIPSDQEQVIPKGYTSGGIIQAINYTNTLTPDEYTICNKLASAILYSESKLPEYYNILLDLENCEDTLNNNGSSWIDSYTYNSIFIINGQKDTDNTLLFNGSNTYFDTNIPQKYLSSGYSIILRVKPSTWTNYKGIFGIHTDNNGIVGIQYSNGDITYSHKIDGNEKCISLPSSDIPINSWTTIIITSNEICETNIYINGDLKSTVTLDTLLPQGNIIVGKAFNSYNRNFKGNISHVIIYNKELSYKNVQDINNYVEGGTI